MDRSNFFLLLFSLIVALFAFRLFYLQVLASEELSGFAVQRSVRTEYLPASRGRFIDRNNVILAANRLTYDLALVFARSSFVGFDINWYRRKLSRLYSESSDDFLPDADRLQMKNEIRRMTDTVRTLLMQSSTMTDISLSTGVDKTYLVDSVSKAFKEVCRGWQYPWKPVIIARDIQWTSALDLVAFPRRYYGWDIVPSLKRDYPWDDRLFHVLGYMKKLSPDRTQLLCDNGVIPGYITLNDIEYEYLSSTGNLVDDNVGMAGLEKRFENVLRGECGLRKTMRLTGKPDRILQETMPVNGRDIVLSIDLNFQRILMEEIEKYGGKSSAIVMDPNTGEIYALCSWPTLSPIRISGSLSPSEADEIFQSPDAPLINRAVVGEYPLGSVFKIVMAAAGLENKAIDPDTVFDCEGTLTAGGRPFKCYHKIAHGRVNLSDALKLSCNIFFYRMSELLEPQAMYTMAREFGLGQNTGIELPVEKDGNLPFATEGSRWEIRKRYQFAIGQWDMLVTPLQAARLVSVIANGGWLVRPTLLKTRFHPDRVKVDLSDTTIARIREGLWRVVNERGGTANSQRASIGVEWSGKTGSAEVGDNIETHSWFGCYVPSESPKYVVVVMCERAGSGGKVAAPIAAEIIERIMQLGK